MTNQIPQNIPLYEKLVSILEDKIINGELQLGDKLPTEIELAETYKVSRTVIREAMKALKEKGWVETQVAKGTYVVDKLGKGIDNSFDAVLRMDPKNSFEHLIEVREFLEPEIAALAAMRITDEQYEKLEEAIEQMDCYENDEKEVDTFLGADYRFHKIMAESTGNPLILMIIKPVLKLMRAQQRYHLCTVKGGGQKSQQNHRLILSAIKSHDPESARKYMLQHVIQVRDDVKGVLGSAGADLSKL